AGALFEQAYQADADIISASKERWAYCKLHRVIDQLNNPAAGGPTLPELEKETQAALVLAPRLIFGKEVLAEIDKRRTGAATGQRPEPTPKVTVQHYERDSDGWARAETTNFRIYHNQTRELADQVAQIVERTRTEMSRKWFGGA